MLRANEVASLATLAEHALSTNDPAAALAALDDVIRAFADLKATLLPQEADTQDLDESLWG